MKTGLMWFNNWRQTEFVKEVILLTWEVKMFGEENGDVVFTWSAGIMGIGFVFAIRKFNT